MNIAWDAFTPLSALMGGILIGLASGAFALLKGRVAGISGIVGGLLGPPAAGDRGWRLAFVAGLLLAPAVYGLFATLPPVQVDASMGTLLIAGLLVGLGTRIGSGCTSGHGVCGLSRLSPRALAATVTFMVAGFVTVALVRHVAWV
ncbi:MAG: YeeE/YedE family protein [Proteobacteria bacterium]|jgi:uncharacterized membrane protein YedE/YeeE|nr:YeeE/YedE family protein [Pseudomonadota bacterium]MDA0868372.1 YeeE/YedE family protein [Pseudomonadota bacterium]MDA1328564.1 YeeE/YedE family protein [Pseudomonadota bacterium]NBR80408.1 YeeE/YedE family protein [Candidatus Fonsibacter lacus]